MERVKVIEAIENCIRQPKCQDCPWEDCEVEHEIVNGVPYGLLRDALAMLKEQEAVDPTINEYGEVFCGNCGENVGIIGQTIKIVVRMRYCPECGRQVKWNERNKRF